ncbi:MAG: DUF5658 family protein [bacterium]|nr:DUF5658 family protein [bacterium]
MRIDVIRSGLMLILGFCVSASFAEDDDSVADNGPKPPDFENTVFSGQLFYDGRHIPGPYSIVVDTTGDGSRMLSVNGIQLVIQADLEDQDVEAGEGFRKRGRPAFDADGRERIARGPGRMGWNPDSAAIGPYPNRRRASPGFRGDPELEGPLPRNARDNPRYESDAPVPAGMQEMTLANQIAFALRRDDIVVAFPGAVLNILSIPSEKADFCRMFVELEPSDSMRGDYLSLVHPQQIDAWSLMPENLQVSQSLENWMRGCIAEADAVFQKNQREIFAVKVMDRSAYPLTIIGMMLGVFALGHTLRWSSLNPVGDEAIRFVRIALMLILAMSALDLIWTALSAAAGEMRELNPMAVHLVDSPGLLVVFKLVVTLLACGILMTLRSQPKAQFATWWMCLVCVLLTFRWVVFQSLMV